MNNDTIAGFRLSPQQERIWSLQRGADAACYRVAGMLQIDGKVDADKLRAALCQVVERHEILRTVFRRQPGMKTPFQVILESGEIDWQSVELEYTDEAARISKVEELFQQECRRNFDFEHGPLVHALLASTDENHHALILSLPSLCADERSLRNLAIELAELCGEFPSVAAEVMQYADFVAWQDEVIEGAETAAGRDFWRNHLREIDSQSLASAALPRETGKQDDPFVPQIVVAHIDKRLPARIQHVGHMRGTLMSEFLLTCWQILLWRYTSQPEIAIGCAFDGRKHEELESALGLYAKHLPLRASLQPDHSFLDQLEAAKNSCAEAYKWQESFAPKNVDDLSSGDGPAFAFEYQDALSPQSSSGISLRLVRSWVCWDRFKLKLVLREDDRGLRAEFVYDSSRIDRASIDRLAGHFITLVSAAAEHPEMAVSRLPLLGAEERREVLYAWNETATTYPKDRCLQQLFEAEAERTPDRLAVVCGERSLTYGELNRQANQLAHHLRRLGVGPDALVSLCVERSEEMMVALLAILKAGGAYVPLNPDTPKVRLTRQLAGVTVAIAEQKTLAQLSEFGGPVVCMDRDQTQWAAEPSINPETTTTPENLVYVIYTSGSTGVPKGVAVTHGNLVNYATFITRLLNLEKHREGLHFATVSTLAADLGNTCLYPALISGGTLHVIPHDIATDAQKLARYTEQHPIDVLKIVPSHLQALLYGLEGRQVLPRLYLITGGEALTRQLLERIQRLSAGCQVINHYGPTETTIGSLTLKLEHYDWQNNPSASIPLGRPIANTQIYILDNHLELVPVGVAGELYIGGAGVTRGYLNQPQLTSERFLKNPFVNDSEARIYRTGDLARYLPDGNIEFLGRGDDQVKVRGFRIELGEIEAVLSRHAAVKQAVVLARAPQENAEKRLVAYLVPHGEHSLATDELRAYLKEQLPDYMVPGNIIVLDKLPLTANGKVDRKALPQPEELQAQEKAYVAPRNPTEEVIANIWGEVLGREGISVEDNFFELGGHSLLATQVISRVRRALDVEVPLRALLESPTAALLARHIENARRSQGGLRLPPITKIPRDQNLPLSFGQQRLWVLDQLDPHNPVYNIARTWRLKGALNLDALEKALNEIVRRHESQRTIFTERDGEPVQVILPSLKIDVPIRDFTSWPEAEKEAEARRTVADEALRPFELSRGPLLRAQLMRLAAQDHVLLLTMHHIVSDAWSATVFFQEFSTLYEAFSRQEPSPLPELPLQYADYASWQRKWMDGEVLERQLAFWRKQLTGAPPLIQLPWDRPRPKVRSFRGARETIVLGAELSKRLTQLSRQAEVTLFMTLLAGFQALLSRYSGQEQIVVGTDIANRTTTETECLIGFFINLLALRTDLSGNPTFRELLRRVRETALGAYAHQDTSFDRLVEELQPERTLAYNPIFQVVLVMQPAATTVRSLAGLELSLFEMPAPMSKYDLGVFVVERPEALACHWLYNPELFERSTVQRMARQFETLLTNAVAEPDARLSTLEIISTEEKLQSQRQKEQRKQSRLARLMVAKPEALSVSVKRDYEE
jgi:amino acid adenylation domain-containing protein